MDEYTVLVEFVEAPNSCEVLDGSELVFTRADSEAGACMAAAQLMGDRGLAPGEFHVTAAVEGTFPDAGEFWDAIAARDEALAEQASEQASEAMWESYAEDLYDARYGN